MYDINELNQRFGTPGRVAFRVNDSGMPMVVLVTGHGSCELSLYGGQVINYRPMGHGPVLFKSRESAEEEGKQIRGGIPLCWPWFGAPPEPALPRHGFARLVYWDILTTEYDNTSTTVTIGVRDTEETRRLWPHSFELVQKIKLSDNLSIEVTTHNSGDAPFDISQSIHPYFKVRDIEQVAVSGVEGCQFTDLLTREENIQEGALKVKKETYYIYDMKQDACAIMDTGLGRTIAMTYSGMDKLVVWNPWREKAKKIEDLGESDYKGMITVAPATLEENRITLEPKGEKSVKISIQATLT